MEHKFIEREWNEDIEGELDELDFFTTPNGSFWDPDYVYFNREGYDRHGGYYLYIPGENWDEKNQCYFDEIEDSFESDSDSFFINEHDYEAEEDKKKEKEENINNNFKNFSLLCNEHISKEIIGLCIDDNCQKNKLICSDCIFQYHIKHDMRNINDVIKQYNDLTQNLDKIKNELEPFIIRKKLAIKMKINRIIHKLLNNCLNINEKNDYLKIKNDLKNINKIYQNSSNLKNGQELSDTILHFWKSYSQENNPQDELFTKIHDKLNQNFNKLDNIIEKQLVNINLNN